MLPDPLKTAPVQYESPEQTRAFRAQQFADYAKELERRAHRLLDQADEYRRWASELNPTSGG
jgi:hypothetical protein